MLEKRLLKFLKFTNEYRFENISFIIFFLEFIVILHFLQINNLVKIIYENGVD